MPNERISVGRYIIEHQNPDELPALRVADLIKEAGQKRKDIIGRFLTTQGDTIYYVIDFGDRGIVATRIDGHSHDRPDPVLIPSATHVQYEDPRRVETIWPETIRKAKEKKFNGDYDEAVQELLAGKLR